MGCMTGLADPSPLSWNVIKAAEAETKHNRRSRQKSKKRERKLSDFQVLPEDIADNEHRACIVAKRQKVTGFIF